MPHRIEVGSRVADTRALVRKKHFPQMKDVFLVDVYTIDKEFSGENLKKIGSALANPVTQYFSVDKACKVPSFDWAVEIGFAPGVTDNIGHTTKEIIQDLLKVKFKYQEAVYTSQVRFIKGKLTREQARAIGESLANPLIQRIYVKSAAEYKMEIVVPRVKLAHVPSVELVDLDVSDEELQKIGKAGIANEDGTRRGPLALDLDSMKVIKNYFDKAGRKPTDMELESLAQTWSEHCKHTIFAASMDEIKDGIYQYYIKRATNEVRKKKGKKDFCVSVFKDNSGGIIFDDKWLVTDKVETHNSPSALDPFGGSITGIVGVNRDSIGFGKGAKPIANRYGFCFADPNDEDPIYKGANNTQKMLSPKRIMNGVIDGVNSGGNCSGIPTPQGFMYFDKRYKGKPLVFVGTVGLIPKRVCGGPSWEKEAQPGDKIVVIGGRVGLDGIHGATFSSEAMDSGSPSTAVQIGDPITQKKLSDAIVKEARDMCLYTSITDNGAGGLSCSVAEMAKECGGCFVNLDDVPLKYPGLDPWQIWISESQERMTLAVPPKHLKAFVDLMERRGVETTIIGDFNDSGKCEVIYHGKKIMDIDLGFLHDGLPEKSLTTVYTKVKHAEPTKKAPADLTKVLHDMMARQNTASFDFVSHQFDHVVQAQTIVGPLHGKGRVNGRASVIAPVLSSEKGVVLSQGLNPKYSDIDTYHMAASAIDTAIRNAVSVGADVDNLALLDNFCWCSSDDRERLGQLKEAAKACYEYGTAYETPFVSGKDSMFNDFKGYDSKGNKVLISVPPTLLVSSFGVAPDYKKCVTLDAKFAGDLVYIVGDTADETGGSEYFDYLGFIGNKIPHVDSKKAVKIYRAMREAMKKDLVASCESVSLGGLGVSLARVAIAGQLGLNIDMKMKQSAESALFSESQSRFVVTINPKKKAAFEKSFKGLPVTLVGKVNKDDKFSIKINGKPVVKTDVKTLDKFYRVTFKNY
ncbi:MAG: AIR synthase-related protein [Candidatus Gracilibacteria bacterium]